MNPNIRVHKDLVVESHQGLQHDEKQQSLTLNQSGSKMSVTELAAHCVGEINNFRRGEPGTETYSVELLRRATMQGDQEARAWIQQCFSQLVLSWLRRHPKRRAACELDSEESYVAQTFERFWQATVLTQHIEFNSLAGALQYLQACLNGVMIDSLRAYSLSKQIPLPDPGEPGELRIEDKFESNDVWDSLKKVIPNANEQRLAYLLFHCGLKPRQIMLFCPQEFSDVNDIYRLRSNMMNRLLRNADLLGWRLN
jgi:hypothetical protein